LSSLNNKLQCGRMSLGQPLRAGLVNRLSCIGCACRRALAPLGAVTGYEKFSSGRAADLGQLVAGTLRVATAFVEQDSLAIIVLESLLTGITPKQQL
jgi:hypothetical protein